MSRPKAFITRIIPEPGLRLVQEFCEVDLWTDPIPPARSIMLERVRGIDGILCLLTDRIDGELLDAAGPQLKVVSNHAVGYDNIDVDAAVQKNIYVTISMSLPPPIGAFRWETHPES